MANFEVLSLDPTTPQIRAPGAGDGYSVPRDMTFATGTTLNAPTTVVSVNTSTDALRITQVGSGNALVVEDSANPDATPTVINASGNVGIGTASPATNLSVIGTGITDASSNGAYQVTVDNNAAYNLTPQGGIIHRFKWSSAGTLTTGAGIRFYKPNTNDSDASSQIGFLVRSGIAAQSQAMTLDSSGNLGLGVTPSAWNTGALQIRNASFWGLSGSPTFSSVGANYYYDGTYKYISTAQASDYYQFLGQHVWRTAASGTAGNAITFTQAMTLDASGNLTVANGDITIGTNGKKLYTNYIANNSGTNLNFDAANFLFNTGNVGIGVSNSPISKLVVRTGTNENIEFRSYSAILGTGTGVALDSLNDARNSVVDWAVRGTNIALYGSGSTPMTFYTNSTARAYISSVGDFGIGTTSPSNTANYTTLHVVGSSGGLFRFNNSGGTIQCYGGSDTAGGFIGTSTNHPFILYTNGSEKARITATGDVGIGTSSPQAKLDVSAPLSSNGPTIRLSSTGTTASSGQQIGAVDFYNSDADIPGVAAYVRALAGQSFGVGGELVFGTQATYPSGVLSERARIDSSGNLLVGTTNTSPSANVGAKIYPAGTMRCVNADSANTTENWSMYSTGAANYRFYVGWGGTVYATNTTISAISDQRYKENIRDLDVGLDAILALKPRKFDWKAGQGKDIKDDRGFIAQEFEQVFPDLVDEWKDPAPEGEEPYKSVRQDLIPVLVKAMQEQQAMIEELKAKVAALEAR